MPYLWPKKLKDTDQVKPEHYNKVIDTLKRLRVVVKGRGVKTRSGIDGTTVTVKGVVGSVTATGNQIQRVKTQEAGTTDGLLSVKVVGADKVEIGSAFDVKTNWAESTSFDMADYFPILASGAFITIVTIDGEKFINWNPILIGDDTSTVGATTADMMGQIIHWLTTNA